jgi:hypothetical protein
MAKDDREILHGVRLHNDRETKTGRQLFKSGMEDELAGAVDQATLDRLVEQGSIKGTWKSTKKKEK